VTAYVLASGGLVLAGGRAADLAGRRRMFLSGLTVFTAASLASGLALSPATLIAARAGQGVGAALLTPAALSIITTTYAGAQRATALATWGALGGAGAAAGVLAGGVLTTWLGWRSVFLVNVPIGVVAGLLSLRMVPRHSAPGPAWRQFDPAGAALGIGGLVSAAYAIAGVPSRGWASAQTLLVFALAAALLAAFAATERQAARPLLPPRLWRSRSLVAGVLVIFGATGLLVGTFFLNSLYLQGVQHASALHGPGVPAARAGDRRQRAPRVAPAPRRRNPRGDRRRAAADGWRGPAADPGCARLGLSHRRAARPAGHRRGHRAGPPRRLGHHAERHRRQRGRSRLGPDDRRS